MPPLTSKLVPNLLGISTTISQHQATITFHQDFCNSLLPRLLTSFYPFPTQPLDDILKFQVRSHYLPKCVLFHSELNANSLAKLQSPMICPCFPLQPHLIPAFSLLVILQAVYSETERKSSEPQGHHVRCLPPLKFHPVPLPPIFARVVLSCHSDIIFNALHYQIHHQKSSSSYSQVTHPILIVGIILINTVFSFICNFNLS